MFLPRPLALTDLKKLSEKLRVNFSSLIIPFILKS